jgi:hypothetical protein
MECRFECGKCGHILETDRENYKGACPVCGGPLRRSFVIRPNCLSDVVRRIRQFKFRPIERVGNRPVVVLEEREMEALILGKCKDCTDSECRKLAVAILNLDGLCRRRGESLSSYN